LNKNYNLVKKYQIKSYIKVNLSLKVLKKLKTGYHNIQSLITFCNLYDTITISTINKASDVINFSGKFSKGISNNKNSITKVLKLLRIKNFLKNKKFKIEIKKNIPHGSGLGGGSSNAACLLNFLSSKMLINLRKSELKKIALKIGHDVPIMLEKKNTFLTGKKNEILRLNKSFKFDILIVYPNLVCSTKKIYLKNKKFTYIKNLSNFNIKGREKIIKYLQKEGNDLEITTTKFYPKIKKIIDFISSQNGCYFSQITGSGSACIGIFSNTKTAIYAQKLIKLKFPKYWCVVSKTI